MSIVAAVYICTEHDHEYTLLMELNTYRDIVEQLLKHMSYDELKYYVDRFYISTFSTISTDILTKELQSWIDGEWS